MTSGSDLTDADRLAELAASSFPFDPTDTEDIAALADRLADVPVLGIGESAHGIEEFKQLPAALIKHLIEHHGVRLVCVEDTLGNLRYLDDYVAGRYGDLDAAMAEMGFWIWKTDAFADLFEWIRAFNRERGDTDRVYVRGYDAQFHDANASALESYFLDVDPAFLDTIRDQLEPLTSPLYGTPDPSFATDEQLAVIDRIDTQLTDAKDSYIDRSSHSAWALASRHVWTLEHGLQFLDRLFDDDYAGGKEIRDPAMAANVRWLREWTGVDRTVVLGHTNHVTRGFGHPDQRGERMGAVLDRELDVEYRAIGMRFGGGQSRQRVDGGFETVDLHDPADRSLEAVLSAVSDPPFYLDFDDVASSPALGELFDGITHQHHATDGGASASYDPPREVMDGVIFFDRVSAVTFFE